MSHDLTLRDVESRILRLPGRPPCMLARDLARLYQTEANQIGQAVRRHPERFPVPDFCFRLTVGDVAALKSQSVTLHTPRAFPLAFTRLGANMLSAVLKTPVAAERAVFIMRAFSALEQAAQKAAPEASAPGIKALPLARYVELLEAENELLRARTRGLTSGPRRPLTVEDEAEIRRLLAEGLSVRQVMLRTGRAMSTIGFIARGAKGGAA